ncbi:lipid-binding SYLF domain-containing protein [Desulfogranum japonicum]|uniref:lipid-binding SYLF domain-containing protein n=1 Tax=Desulfogranum japonicum TaxID=231447 RepID=UPI0003FB8D88|nr:YSC84-related protein [Desulfogranum japonicum]
MKNFTVQYHFRKSFSLPCIQALTLTILLLGTPQAGFSATAEQIDSEVELAMNILTSTIPAAKKMAPDAKGILIFPSIIKGGLIIGGQYGEGALQVPGKTTKYYKTVSASYGLQIGAQTFGYALFFMDEKSLGYLQQSKGWEIGVGPSVVLVDEGLAKSMSSTTVQDGIYAFFFSQKGLMAGLGIQGSKISQYTPAK